MNLRCATFLALSLRLKFSNASHVGWSPANGSTKKFLNSAMIGKLSRAKGKNSCTSTSQDDSGSTLYLQPLAHALNVLEDLIRVHPDHPVLAHDAGRDHECELVPLARGLW